MNKYEPGILVNPAFEKFKEDYISGSTPDVAAILAIPDFTFTRANVDQCMEYVPTFKKLFNSGSLAYRTDIYTDSTEYKKFVKEFFFWKNLTMASEIKDEIIETVPALRHRVLNSSDQGVSVKGNLDLLRTYYFEYLYRKSTSRKLILDTNNLMIDIERGEGSVLEEFKLMHRAVDVEKADLEAETIWIENQRKYKLFTENRLGDPHIDKIVAVSSSSDLKNILNIDTGTDE